MRSGSGQVIRQDHVAQAADSDSACWSKVWTAASCKSGGYDGRGLGNECSGSDPNEDEITIAERASLAKNLGGWLAIKEGDPWGGSPPRLLEVRPLAAPTSNFSGVADACIVQILAKRDEAKE
jgi:hypothetical protein